MKYLRIYESANDGSVDLHPLHGADELPDNSEAARILADHGYRIELLPSLPETEVEARQEWLADVADRKNPDIRINEAIIGDIKTPDPDIEIRQTTISRCVYRCGQQKVSIAVINLVNRNYTIQDVKKGIIGALQPDRNKSIDEVWILTANRMLFKAPRVKVFDESIYEELDTL